MSVITTASVNQTLDVRALANHHAANTPVHLFAADVRKQDLKDGTISRAYPVQVTFLQDLSRDDLGSVQQIELVTPDRHDGKPVTYQRDPDSGTWSLGDDRIVLLARI